MAKSNAFTMRNTYYKVDIGPVLYSLFLFSTHWLKVFLLDVRVTDYSKILWHLNMQQQDCSQLKTKSLHT